MPLFEPRFQSAYPDDFMDSLANLTASILQEHLAPIVQTLQEHAKLMDVHTALLNHSTVMNRYNVGKIEDIRDFQNNINYKLQHFVYPEDRYYPEYQAHPDPTAGDTADTTNPFTTENNAETPEAPERRPSPPVTEPADSRPNTPRQQQGDGFSVVPGPSRRLQRERPFSVEPDPMWNSIREINPYMRLAAPAPPPPYLPPPAYADEDRVPHVGPQTSSQAVQRLSPAPLPLVCPPSASEEEEEEEVDASLSSRAAGERRSIADHNRPSSPSSNGTIASDDEDASRHGSGDGQAAEDAEPPPTRLSEKVRGKKRMRDEDDGDNPLEEEDSPSWRRHIEGDNPLGEGSSRDPSSGRHRKRQKQEDSTIKFNLDPLKIDDGFALAYLSIGGFSSPQPDSMRRRHVEKLKAMQKMFCGGRDLH